MAAIKDIVGEKLLTKDGIAETEGLTNGKIVGLYFSAHWCPPCRGFTPVLAEQYKKMKSEGKNFEIIFISSDRSQDDFQNYYNEMPWIALPFAESEKITSVKQKYGIRGIPTLIILDTDGTTISADGRSLITSKPDGFPWK